MTGYEVNRSWWEGSHSIPHFINISKYFSFSLKSIQFIQLISEFVDEFEERSCIIPSDNALMFCYFNNLQYFYQYIQSYKGTLFMSNVNS